MSSPASRPRVAVLAHTHPTLTSGGAEISAYTLYKGLRALGMDAVFIAAAPNAHADRARLDTSDEYLVGYEPEDYDPYYHHASPTVTRDTRALLDDLGVTHAVFHHFLNFGLHTLESVARARPGRTALVLHEFLALCHHHGQMVTRPALRLCTAPSPGGCATCFDDRVAAQFVARRAGFLEAFDPLSALVSPSRFLRERFVAWGVDERADRPFAVIENGLATLPGPPPARPLVEAPLVVGFFGQINPFKGVDLLLDAAERLARQPALAERVLLRIHGPLVGVSPEFEARFAKALAAHPFLEWRGAYANDQVHALMHDCDFVLMASRWWENSPVVIQEAHACGRPLIVPGLGGMREKVADNVSGLHFRPGDASDLVRVLALAASPGTQARLAASLPPAGDAAAMARAYLSILGLDAPAPSSPASTSFPSPSSTSVPSGVHP